MRKRKLRRLEWKERWQRYKRLYKGSRDERREKWRAKWVEYLSNEHEAG
ncbi:hypothetical protein [Ammoniphilus oxalaticus]|nr:hypothetical protein [Ammoniphilus oxalaticus]